MVMERSLTPAMEDYLKLIFNLGKKTTAVRIRDIAKEMKVRMSSVTSMLNTLSRKNLINHEKYEHVELTSEGMKIAQEISLQHEVLFNFLNNILKIDSEVANEDACRMEHAISPVTLKKMIQFMQFIETCPRTGKDWLKHFESYCQQGRPKERCEKYIETFIKNYPKNLEKLKGGKMKEVPLMELSPGEKGEITKVKGSGQIKQRILAMGIVPGTSLEVERVAPLGDPIEVKVKGYHLSLRKEEAKKIYVEIA